VRPVAEASTSSCTLVVVDNNGGGIFDFLPQASAVAPERFEQLFATPQAPRVGEVAKGFGLPVDEAKSVEGLTAALGDVVGRHHLAVVRAVVPNHAENVVVHERIRAAVAAACSQL
jgi:2-succinyl-5-enolpyruvyl-6-hydroxy-3-cyclohexene-1-carboxylate synthase